MKRMKMKKRQMCAMMLILVLLTWLFMSLTPMNVHAYTVGQRPSLKPHDVTQPRDRILETAKVMIAHGNDKGYSYGNYVLNGTNYPSLAGQAGFDCVRMTTHIIYVSTASQINGVHKSVNQTTTTSHTFASSNGLVLTATYTDGLRSEVNELSNLYTMHGSTYNVNNLEAGDIVWTGDKNAKKSNHAMFVIGPLSYAEAVEFGIGRYWVEGRPYLVSMGSVAKARIVGAHRLNRLHDGGDPNKGYFVKAVAKPKFSIPQYENGGFRIRKADAMTGAALVGAEFDLKNSSGVVMEHVVMTRSSYTSADNAFLPGTYTLTETIAPPGYTLDPTPRTLEIVSGEINSVYWDNPIPNEAGSGNVSITKKDKTTGATVAGAVFDLSQSSTFPSESTLRVTTRADGTTLPQSFALADGTTVYVREVSVPAPYILDTTVQKVTLIAGQTVGVTFNNVRAQGRIAITKLGSNDTPIQGAKFNVKNSGGATVATLTTDASGKATTGTLPLGTYTVTETFVPAPYILDPTPQTLTIAYANQTTPIVTVASTFANDKAVGSIEVIKLEAEDETPIEGAIFEVWDESEALVATLTTDSEGKATTGNLPLGTYTVTETFVPAPYILDPTPQTLTIAYANQTTPIVTVASTFANDKAVGSIEVIKLDAEDETPIEGAIFEVRDESEALVATLTTDFEGKATTGTLPLGTYTVTETFVPAPYILDPTPQTLTIAYADQTTPIVTVASTFANDKAVGSIEVIKLEADDETPIEGAIFEVRDESEALVATLTTDSSGKATTGNLPLGTYTVTETFVPAPYILDPTPQTLTIAYANQTTPIVTVASTFTNTKAMGRIAIRKADRETGESLAGATYEVRDHEDNVVDTVTTDATGNAITKLLPLGDYTIHEMVAPAGYSIDATVFTASITYDASTPVVVVALTVENDKTSVTLTKTDIVTGAPVADALIEIYDTEGAVIRSVATEADGTITIEGLPHGTYTFREVLAPEGYILNDTTFEFTIDEYGNVEGVTEFTNEPTSLTIHKIDEAGNGLSGAEFMLRRLVDGAEDEVMRFRQEHGYFIASASGEFSSLISSDEGAITIYGLPLGSYSISEVVAPKGFIRILDPTMIDLTEDPAKMEVELRNERTPTPPTGERSLASAVTILIVSVSALMATACVLRRRDNASDNNE
jgi:uncharacterized surface anchored protein